MVNVVVRAHLMWFGTLIFKLIVNKFRTFICNIFPDKHNEILHEWEMCPINEKEISRIYMTFKVNDHFYALLFSRRKLSCIAVKTNLIKT